LKTQQTKKEIRTLILDTVIREKPENTEKLRQLMQQEIRINPWLITQILLELENEGKLQFKNPEPPTPTSVSEFIFSKRVLWYWIILTLSIVTSISVFTIPEAIYPLAFVRNTLGIIFMLFLPGLALIKTLFPATIPIKTTSENLDNIELIALSLGLSIALTIFVGLILNHTPWGITLTSITLVLLGLTVIISTAALLRALKLFKLSIC
jgi:hypothetical protein